jgi:hypothetical protein
MAEDNIEQSELPDSRELAPLETFNPKVFIAENKEDQEVCNFVLMLALINNDFKDLLWSYQQLNACKLDPIPPLSSYNGQCAGMRSHLTRLSHSLFCELAQLIDRNPEAINHPLFLETFRQLNKQNKVLWEQLLVYSKGGPNSEIKELRGISLLIRNNISFHYYQPKFLSQGYKDFFSRNSGPENRDAFISRGNSLQSSRFYFADAAVEGCFDRTIPKEMVGRVRPALNRLSEIIVQVLYDIVTSFVQLRLTKLKDGFRSYQD